MIILWIILIIVIIFFILHALFKYNLSAQNLQVLWIFWIIVLFCGFIFLGLHLTEGLDSIAQIVLTWIVYAIMCTTFINVFVLGYFWSVVRNKSGPTGIRGSAGETGIIGYDGTCDISAPQSICIEAISSYIDALYFAQTQTHILNEETQRFPCNYLNDKISVMAGSSQYTVIISNVAVANAINYIKSIWAKWFDLIYNGTNVEGVWFTDEFADENYEWVGNNPFDEIKKYDIYYWGITRDFRPLKAEICRSTPMYQSSKLPMPNAPHQPRLKIIQTNDYYPVQSPGRGTASSDDNHDASIWSPKVMSIGADTYYPISDILTIDANTHSKSGKTIIGDMQYDVAGDTGPDMKTILVSGDIVDPISYKVIDHTAAWSSSDNILISKPVCPSGYQSIGTVSSSDNNGYNTFKCVPSDCVEYVAPPPASAEGDDTPNQWDKYHKYYRFPKW